MNIVGQKSSTPGAVFFLSGLLIAIVGGAMIALGYSVEDDGTAVFFGVIFILTAVGMFGGAVYYLILPRDLIGVKDDAIIFLKKNQENNQEIMFCDIDSITPRTAKARGFSYTHGKIIITTIDGQEYTQGSIYGVEDVAAVLNKIIRQK